MAKNRPECCLGHRLTHSCFTQASGSSIDWVYEKAHVKYSYALELRDQGQTGFMLPNNQVSNLNIWCANVSILIDLLQSFENVNK